MQITDIIIIAVLAIVAVTAMVYLVINQKKRVIEWLKYATTEAEKQLGGKTGQLKLRLVYDWFVAKFPIVSSVITFAIFSSWVDTALITLQKWLNSDGAIKSWIEPDESEK